MKNKSIILSLLLLAFVPLFSMESLMNPVDQVIKTAYENPSVEILEQLNLLLGQFPEDLIKSQKLQKAIAEVSVVLEQQPGVRIEREDDAPVSPQPIKILLAKEDSSADEFDVVEIVSNKLPIVQESITIKEMLEDLQGCDPSQGMVLPNLTKKQLEQILFYLEDIHYINQAKKNQLFDEMKDRLQQVKEKLCKESFEDLIALYKNANYLDISLLLDLSCEQLADGLKQPDQLEAFKNDLVLNLPQELKFKLVQKLIKRPEVFLNKYLLGHLPKKKIRGDSNCWQTQLSPCGNYIAVYDSETIYVYELKNGIPLLLEKIKAGSSFYGMIFSPDGQYLLYSVFNVYGEIIKTLVYIIKNKVSLIGTIDYKSYTYPKQIGFTPDSKYINDSINVYHLEDDAIYKVENEELAVYQDISSHVHSCYCYKIKSDNYFSQLSLYKCSGQGHKSCRLIKVLSKDINCDGGWDVIRGASLRGNYLCIKTSSAIYFYKLNDDDVILLDEFKERGEPQSSVFCKNPFVISEMEKLNIYWLSDDTVTLLTTLDDHNAWTSVELSDDNRYLASSSSNGAYIYDLQKFNDVRNFLKNNCSLEQALLLNVLFNNDQESLSLTEYPYLLSLFYSLPQDIQHACADEATLTVPKGYWVSRNFGSIVGGATAVGMGAILAMNWLKK